VRVKTKAEKTAGKLPENSKAASGNSVAAFFVVVVVVVVYSEG